MCICIPSKEVLYANEDWFYATKLTYDPRTDKKKSMKPFSLNLAALWCFFSGRLLLNVEGTKIINKAFTVDGSEIRWAVEGTVVNPSISQPKPSFVTIASEGLDPK